jgi:formylglycine-generating enzyme required for sulfatase activity
MAIIAKAAGGAYCIDEIEVTKGLYNKFITANVPTGDQDEPCKSSNATFIPRGAWPPSTVPDPPGLAGSMGLPVHYVDWCDAFEYCRWAKKQLCGAINGGPITQDAGNNSTVDAWHNACSAQGTKTWPYANSYDHLRCKGSDYDGGGDFGFASNEDDGLYAIVVSDAIGNYTSIKPAAMACQGGSVGLYVMSGNTAEWENACDGPTAGAQCSLRGGSYNANGAAISCDAIRTEVRMPAAAAALKDVGFRCCLY